MSEETAAPPLGSFGWTDLTVPDATAVRDFYAAVAGWSSEPVDMGGYSDWVMKTPMGVPVGGICNARGGNASLPAAWIVYIVVPDLDAALAAARGGGGTVIDGPKGCGADARYAVLRDPAGAVFALYAKTAA